ncbi:MAG: MopE-related protein [Myxococcota bacterium]
MRLFLFPLLLAACDAEIEPEKEPCEQVTRFRDLDEDGYGDATKSFTTCNLDRGVATGTDCNDADATIHPDAVEDCAVPVDNNCDGSVGSADLDGDGAPACEDCDDADGARNPDASERCNEVDDDCDGVVDDTPVDAHEWHPDADLDGYGAAVDPVRTCTAPAGYLASRSDCDDTRADVSPAAAEVCNDIDDDCDGTTDGASAIDRLTWYTDRDGDGWGEDGFATEACDAPARGVADGGDCDDGDAAINPGATEVCNRADDDCDGGTDDAEATDALAWPVDADRDGHGHLTETVLACVLPADAAEDADDCDDADPTAYPGASESCDDVDDDCDGTVDEEPVDATTWYADADGDGLGGAALTTACDAPPGAVVTPSDCDDTNAAVGGASTWYADDDGDTHGDPASPRAACTAPAGYVAGATDCDDTDATTFPGAVETCDGDDDDCDGTVDEPDAADASSWYADDDADGHGGADIVTTGCTAPVGTVASSTDCDDDDDARHPGAAEADCADPVDYNCDGSVGYADADGDGHAACEECDDADPTMYAGYPWYADTDGDTYGDATASVDACDTPVGFVANATDCDDADGAVHPAATESCDTVGDDDCDGDTNDRNATGCTRWYWDDDGDGYGSTTNACYCEPEGLLTADNRDDCDDGDAATSPFAEEAWGNGVDDDCDDAIDVVALAASDAILLGETTLDQAGYTVSGAGDVDADGYDDLLIGAPDADRTGLSAGLAYLVRGPVFGTSSLASAEAVFAGEAVGDEAGTTLAAAGDVDGDGFGDVLVTAPFAGSETTGTVYLLRGPLTGAYDLAEADAIWTGRFTDDLAGDSLDGGADLDGDGLDDVLVGASGSDAGGRESGAAYVVSGLLTGTNALASATAILVGEDAADEAGGAGAVASDIDGDGVADLLVGALGDDDVGAASGAVYVLYGPVSGSIDLSLADAKLVGEADLDNAGEAIDAPGDLDGDGLDDILVGADDARTGGAAYLVLGAPVGAYSLADADAIFEGVAAIDKVGSTVAGVGDVNGDGNGDLLFGNYAYDTGRMGAAYLVFGPMTGTRSPADADGTFAGASGDVAARSVAAAGDTNADGFADFVVGVQNHDGAADNAGAAALLLGR